MSQLSADTTVRFQSLLVLAISFQNRRQQYQQEMSVVPTFAHLYDVSALYFITPVLSDGE